jgi:hypothetical protein
MLNNVNSRDVVLIKDEILDPEHLGNYHLSLGFGDSGLLIGIVDSENHRCLYFEIIPLPGNISENEYIKNLNLIFDDHPLIPAGFWKTITVYVQNSLFTFVPDEYYNDEQKEDWLCMATGRISEPGTCISYYHKSLKAHIVFSMPSNLHTWLKEKYPLVEIKFVHQISALIEGFLLMKQSGKWKEVFGYLNGKYLTIVVFGSKNLLLANRYACHEVQDFARYTMMVFNQFGLDPAKDPVTLYGNFEEDAAALAQYRRYFRNVKQGKRPWKLYFGYPFDEVAEHKHFGTFSSWFCR